MIMIVKWHHNNHHTDIQHNGTQHNNKDLQQSANNTEHNDTQCVIAEFRYGECRYAESHLYWMLLNKRLVSINKLITSEIFTKYVTIIAVQYLHKEEELNLLYKCQVEVPKLFKCLFSQS